MKKLKTPQDVQRRKFLKTVGESGLSASLLKAFPVAAGLMYSRAGIAAPSEYGFERAVFVFIPDGAPPGTYIPTGSLGSLTMNETSMPMDPHKDDTMFFSGCTSNVGGHGSTGKLLGRATGVSNTLDVQLEKTLGASSAFPSIQLGVESSGPISYRAGATVTMQDDPNAAFNRLFGGEVDTSDAGMKRAQTLLDSNRRELDELKSKLGSFELDRLDETENAIQALERRLADSNTPIEGCAEYSREDYTGSLTTNMSTINALQCETIAMAFRCNLTKVATLQLDGSQANHVVPSISGDKTYHNSIHGGSSVGNMYADFRTNLTAQLAELVRVLKTTNDANGVPLLDSTLILQVTDMGDGGAHNNHDCPFTLATSNPSIVTGRVYAGTNNNKLLNTVAHALGVQDQVTNFGGAGHDSGILS